ncbi:MAG: hypothetical protein WB643_06110 [Candidatus Bathyarchaeia archaeon]
MTQASEEHRIKMAIIDALRKASNERKEGLGHNELFGIVKRDMRKPGMSPVTFHKYLMQLVADHIVEANPKDGRAVIISLISEETTEYLQMVQAFRDIEGLTKRVRWTHSEKTYNVQEGEVVNLIRVAHSLYSRLHENKIPIDTYMSVESEGPLVRLMSSGRVSALFEKEARLEKLLGSNSRDSALPGLRG